MNQPPDGDERTVLLGWLAVHREALRSACAGLSDEQLVQHVFPSEPLSLLGLVRHLAEMERTYGVWANCCTSTPVLLWGPSTEEAPERGFECSAGDVASSMRAWRDEQASTDAVVRALPLDDAGGANGRSVRWNLLRLIGEYARHNGQAELLRARLGALTGT